MATVHDPPTKLLLAEIGIGAGSRCLDVGAGEGSIARWMANRTGPAGRVVATDADVTHLKPSAGVEVYRHDINEGMPVASSFDLIHVRNVLMRLPKREQIFAMLLDSLAPAAGS
ncbi:MAG: class I SAM-dependent methyltransferase [Actinomycetia bacterium]|nr:class I SAM-dependent methyltransferase [Actinomycetes bacterium]